MTALAFEGFSAPSRRHATRRTSRSVGQELAPKVLHAAIASVRGGNVQLSKTNQAGIAALVLATIALHLGVLNFVRQQGPVATVKPKVVAMAIEIAPPPPPVIPPKPVPQKIARSLAPKVEPSLPVVRSDAVIDPTPSPDAVQVATAPAPAPTPPVVEHITEPRGYAGYLNNPAPSYPPAALLKGLQGHVILNVHVLASGHSEAVTVFKTSGQRILDDSAVKTVATWLFEPAKRGETPVDGWVKVPINFKIS